MNNRPITPHLKKFYRKIYSQHTKPKQYLRTEKRIIRKPQQNCTFIYKEDYTLKKCNKQTIF